MNRRPRWWVGLLALGLTGCSLVGTGNDEPTPTRGAGTGEVVLLTHDSWAMPKRLVRAFESDTGLDLTVRSIGDAGSLTNKLVLTKDDPEGDVAYGVDNTFASRALDEGVFTASHRSLPPGADAFALPGDDGHALAPVDSGAVCVNVDKDWFAAHHQKPPRTLDDLADPAYRDLFVTPAATTSSPGLAFLLATISQYGVNWPDYWARLMANGTKITSGWSDAYYVDFTAGGESGDRPIVVSYDSSPAFTLADGGRATTTKALLGTCFQQVEYAGVLAHAADPDGAEKVVQWLLSPEVQAVLPTKMYVFPVRSGVPLPREWARFAKRPSSTHELDPDEVASSRQAWLTQWQDITSR
jgi:thiamine transport system substrate-binding protein